MMATEREWAEYNCIDSATDFKIWNEIKDEVYADDYRDAYLKTMALYPVLEYMMVRGIKLDSQALADTHTEVSDKIAQVKTALRDKIGFDLNVDSPKQCTGYFYGVLGIKPYLSRTAPHNPTCDDKALARLVRRGFKEARLVQEIRGLDKLKGTYLDIELEDDGRMRCSYNPRGTVNRRLSSSKSVMMTGTNMQNLPPQFKKFLIADDNAVFFELDKRQAEWVITGFCANDARMIQIHQSGIDPHLETAHLMTGASHESIMAEYKVLGSTTDQDELERMRAEYALGQDAKFLPRSMTMRQAGKRSNHGLNYDMGYKRFALENEIPEVDAKRMVRLYHEAYVGLHTWYEQIQAQLSKSRTLVNCFGSKRRFLNAWNTDLFKAAYDFLPQSTVADIVNDFMTEMYNTITPDFELAEILAQTHDSCLTQIHDIHHECDWIRVARTLLEMKRMMDPVLNYSRQDFVVATDLKMGLNWGKHDNKRNPKGMIEIAYLDDVNELADLLEQTYVAFTR